MEEQNLVACFFFMIKHSTVALKHAYRIFEMEEQNLVACFLIN